MKHLNEQLTDQINEARNVIEYRVSMNDVHDSHEMPATITILIDRSVNQKEFEKWLEGEEGNTFAHAEGGNVEY